jgi:hypothetical protein
VLRRNIGIERRDTPMHIHDVFDEFFHGHFLLGLTRAVAIKLILLLLCILGNAKIGLPLIFAI